MSVIGVSINLNTPLYFADHYFDSNADENGTEELEITYASEDSSEDASENASEDASEDASENSSESTINTENDIIEEPNMEGYDEEQEEVDSIS